MHLIHTGRCPSYIGENVQHVADHASRTDLRSASTAWYILPRLWTVFGRHAFSFFGAKAWKVLPDRFHSIEPTDYLKKNSLKRFYLITLFSHPSLFYIVLVQ